MEPAPKTGCLETLQKRGMSMPESSGATVPPWETKRDWYHRGMSHGDQISSTKQNGMGSSLVANTGCQWSSRPLIADTRPANIAVDDSRVPTIMGMDVSVTSIRCSLSMGFQKDGHPVPTSTGVGSNGKLLIHSKMGGTTGCTQERSLLIHDTESAAPKILFRW
eukprot:1161049-Pelagomonas_calceolata.AAC.5